MAPAGRVLTAGTARVVITPPVGIAPHRLRRPAPVHRRARRPHRRRRWCSASATRESGRRRPGVTRVALVALDLIGLPGDALTRRSRSAPPTVTGIAARARLPHLQPHPLRPGARRRARGRGDGPAAVAYREALPHHIAGAVAMGDAARQPVTLAAGRGAVRVGINRRERKEDGRLVLGQHPAGALDSEVLVWRFDDAGAGAPGAGGPAGLGAPHGPAGRGAWSTTPAMPSRSVARCASSRRTSPASCARWWSGSSAGRRSSSRAPAGNINPSLMGPDWEHPRLLGHALGAEAARVALLAQPDRLAPPARRARDAGLPRPACRPRSRPAGRASPGWRRIASSSIRPGGPAGRPGAGRAVVEHRAPWSAPAGAWPRSRAGSPPAHARATWPPCASATRRSPPTPPSCSARSAWRSSGRPPSPGPGVAGYTDGSAGYFPTRAAYPEGGYEVERACRVDPEAGEMLEETSRRLLRSLA